MQLAQYLNEKRYNDFEIIETTPNYGYVRFELMDNGEIHHDHIIFDNKTLEVTYATSEIFFMSCDSYRDLFEYKKDDLCGIIDAFGNEILPCIYSSINLDTDGASEPDEDTLILATEQDKKSTLFDKNGKAVSKTYDFIDYCDYSGLFSIRQDNKYGIIDKSGTEIIKPKYNKLSFAFNCDEPIKYLMAGYDWEKKGVIDLKENVLIPFEYHTIRYLGNDTFFLITNDDKFETIKVRV